jgi:hypothetical protein
MCAPEKHDRDRIRRSVTQFIGITGYQWLLFLAAVQAALLMPDAFVGHYRSGFTLRAQYVPFVIGVLLALSAIAAAVASHTQAVARIAEIAGTLALASGVVGAGYHHWYGITTKPGGYHWLLHHLMHHAPPLAPLALSTAGALEVLAALGTSGSAQVWGIPLRALALTVVGVTLVGAAMQAGLLHYRGAYNNAAMYIPVVVLPLAAAAAFWNVAASDNATIHVIASSLLWLTFVSGFVGAGMHLRGMDRQMGGLYIGVAAILDAPPAGAPLFIAALSASGLVAMQLL